MSRTKAPPPAAAPAPPADPGRFDPALPLASIVPSPHNPRKTFDEAELAKLAGSIREKGVLQPVVVRPLALWQRVCRFVADQWRKHETAGSDYGLHRSQFARAGVEFRSEGEYDAAIAQLVDEGRAERSTGLNGSYNPTAGALSPVTNPESMGDADRYELVAGERRVRASKLAGRETIPALVRDLDDKAAAAASVVENDQREDVPPLEQAHGYRRLLDLGDDAAGVAAKIGRSEDYVLERLQLTKLIPALQEDLAKGHITFTHARTLAKVERPEDQAKIREENLYDDHPDDGGEGATPVPVSHLRRVIATYFRRDLAGAPWKLDDAALVPDAGSCAACPKRSGSRPGLFDELADGDGRKKADQCFDKTCFDAKHAAVIDLGIRKAAEKQGGVGPVLKVTTDHYSRDRDVLRADQYDVVSAKEAKDAKPGEVKQAVIADGKRAGQVVTVRVKKEPAPSRNGSGTDYAAQDRARLKKAEAGKRAGAAAAKQVADRLLKAVDDTGAVAPKGLPLFRLLTASIAEDLGVDACRIVAHRRGLPKNPTNQRQRITDHVGGLATAGECLHLLAELAAARKAFGWGAVYGGSHMDAEEKAFWAAFGVDRGKLEKEAAEALKKPAATPAAKPSANGHAKPKGKKAKARAAAGAAGDEDDGPSRSRPAASPAKWRALPVEDLSPSGVAIAKLHIDGITTCGELADALDMADTLGLDPPDLRAMQKAIDDVRADDGEPHPTLCPPRACRACGCTDEDCSGCVEKTGEPCSWVELDLCSACVGVPAGSRNGPPPLKGESIDQLDVSAEDLDAAHLGLAFKGQRRLVRPLAVKAVFLNGRRHVVTAALEVWLTGGRAWEVRPLHALDEYARTHGLPVPVYAPAEPTATDPWGGVRVKFGPDEYVIGPKGEQRRLIEPPAKSKKSRVPQGAHA